MSSATVAILALSGLMDVSDGVANRASAVSSKPATLMSDGADRPCSYSSRSTPAASGSLKQNRPSGRSSRLSSERIAAAPLARV